MLLELNVLFLTFLGNLIIDHAAIDVDWLNLTLSDSSTFTTPVKEKPKTKEEKIAEWVTELTKQDKRGVRPNTNRHKVNVDVAITLNNIREISEGDMTYSVDFFFSESWIDPRLAFNRTIYEQDEMTLEQTALDFIWTPDTYFLNAVTIAHVSSSSMSHKYGIRVSFSGRIVVSRRISGKFECAMDLVMYPFDFQKCLITLSSYMHEDSVIEYRWSTGGRALVIGKMEKLPNFGLKEHNKRTEVLDYGSRKYSSLEICFLFDRNAGFCYMQLMVPATSVVLSSWLSLWLENHTQINDLLTTILAIIFLSYSYNSMMPRVSYVKAMDIYLLACFAFIFLSLAKLIIVKYLKNKAEQEEKDILTVDVLNANDDEIMNLDEDTIAPAKENESHFESMVRKATTTGRLTRKELQALRGNLLRCFHAIQLGSQLILPLIFGAFCVFFFLIYPFSVKQPSC